MSTTPSATVVCGTCYCIVRADDYMAHSEWHSDTRTWSA